MGSAGIDDSSQKAIEPELIEVGSKLLRHPPSTDELLMLLDVCEFMRLFLSLSACVCGWWGSYFTY